MYGPDCDVDVLRLRIQGLRLSIRTGDGCHGRTTMLGTKLKFFGNEGHLLTEREIQSVHEFRDALESHFGIVP